MRRGCGTRRRRGRKRRGGVMAAPYAGMMKRGCGKRKGGFIGALAPLLPSLIPTAASLVGRLFKGKKGDGLRRKRRRGGALQSAINQGPLS